MSFEWIKAKEQEKKAKELTDKEIIEQEEKVTEHLKTKEKIKTQIETDDELTNLKDLVEKWVITKETAEKIAEGKNINPEELEEMFDKIDEIEDIKDIDKYLPEDLRVSKDEYKQAVENSLKRTITLTKLNTALTLLADQITWDNTWGLNLFSWFLSVLDKNLQKVQENTIDIKDSLEEIDKNEWINIKKWWFINLIKEIFTK